MSREWLDGQADALEDFDVILEESDFEEDEEEEVECLDLSQVEGEEPEELEAADLHDTEYLGPEGVGPPPKILGLYTQEGEPIPLDTRSQPSSPLRSPLRDPLSASPVAEIRPEHVVVTLEEGDLGPAQGDDDDALGEEFHLADEHLGFLQRGCERRCQRGRGRGRGARRGRADSSRRQTGEPQWKKGDRLIEVYMNDDDVPDDLREMVMRVVNAREATRERLAARARRQTTAHEEEWVDADDGEDETLFAWEDSLARFEWLPMDNYSSEREQFLPQQVGPVVASDSAYGAFRQYWDDGILSHIVTETNRYARGLAESSASFAREWYDTNIHEILVLFSFWMMLGIIRMPSTRSCFTTNPLLQTNIFKKMFTSHRYTHLCRALHFNDNSNRPTDNSDRLFSFGPIIDHLNSRFKEAYVPSQNVCIDESLTLWKGNLAFRQYIKTKAAKFGVKTFELCESSTGYLWSFFVYLGKHTTYHPAFPSTLLKSTATVLKLIHPLLDKGYTLFMDNWFNSPLLARFLKTRKTDCVGTLRSNCRNIPPLIPLCTLKEGQITARHSGDIVVMAYQDKKRKISTISTYHGIQQGRMEPKPYRAAEFKPQVILDYNKGMGGVDRKDQMLEPYLLERKRCAKWTMKVFKRLLNCSILNARIHLEASTSTRKKHLVFRLELVEQLLQHHHKHMPKLPQPPPPPRPGTSILGELGPRPRVATHHVPRLTDGFMRNGRRVRRRCYQCAGQNNAQRRTSYVCCICDVPLCLEPCFPLYHSNL